MITWAPGYPGRAQGCCFSHRGEWPFRGHGSPTQPTDHVFNELSLGQWGYILASTQCGCPRFWVCFPPSPACFLLSRASTYWKRNLPAHEWQAGRERGSQTKSRLCLAVHLDSVWVVASVHASFVPRQGACLVLVREAGLILLAMPGSQITEPE